jgi:hypothetical protein
MRKIAVATMLGYDATDSGMLACIAELQAFLANCEEAATKAVVFVCSPKMVTVTEEVIRSIGFGDLVDVCPVQVATTDINYHAREYGRAHRLEVMCV